jgi:hypothetical protein
MTSYETLLENVTETGAPPRARVKDSKSLYEIYKKLKDADDKSSRNRAEIQAMFDGVPPYSDTDLISSGQAYRCNVNFDEASAILESSMAGYIDLIHSVEHLLTLKTDFGDSKQRIEMSSVISEELTRAIRSWPQFHFNYLLLCQYFIAHGIGIVYWEDDIDWRWKVSMFGDFLIPRKTLACEDEIEVAVCVRSYQAHQLFKFIEDPEVAADMGWNVEQVRKALLKATQGNTGAFTDWEHLQNEFKNNDLFTGTAGASEIKVLHAWVKEFDGTVSYYMTLENNEAEDFLCVKRNIYNHVNSAFVFFPFGIGTNGYYHSIRGLGYKIFPQIQLSNRLRCQMADGAMLSSTLLLQPQNEQALEELNFTYYGPYSVLAPDQINVVERAMPDVSKTAMPFLQDLVAQMQYKTGAYENASSAINDNREKTKFETQAILTGQSRLSLASLNLFYEPWGRVLKEVVRRFVCGCYVDGEPGSREILEFKNRCMMRGVPPEAIAAIDLDSVRPVRAIGSGSEAARLLATDELTQLMPGFDEYGRKAAIRDRVAARFGYDLADRYTPPPDAEARPVIDVKMAMLENPDLQNGVEIQILPNENHLEHARVHLAALGQLAEAVEGGAAPIEGVIDGMVALFGHTTMHVEQVSQDVTIPEEGAMLRQSLQQFGEIVNNGVKQVQKMREQQAAQGPDMTMAQEQAAPITDDFTDKLEQKLQEHQLKLQMMQEVHRTKLNLRVAEVRQKLALRDAEVANKLTQIRG